MSTVKAWSEPVVIPTYEPAAPDPNPMFLEKRVYQGSSGRVYPLPFIDRIAETPVNRAWEALHIENEYIYAMILPELGGRIHIGYDKTNGYDFFYRQNVIKPALVGLAGPWISGGVEFNWPQHHRPATFMPVDWCIEEDEDGGRTIWLGDHDPMARMKGMHGVRLRPGSACLELRVRVHNRTRQTQTFLWWANVATRVHEAYQSFFPTDVNHVADHARRSMSAFPLCEGHYYGVDYAARGRDGVPAAEAPDDFVPPCDESGRPLYAPNDLSWYANIPVPTSYMCMGSRQPFFGGYDHAKQAGVVHVANPHISPGKKQWTWGNHEFGYAWDRNLTDSDGPYIELMAGVYTDNQPDFSFLQPGETKSWAQTWYPIQGIGPTHFANLDAALSLSLNGRTARIGASVTRMLPAATLRLLRKGDTVAEYIRDLAPGRPFVESVEVIAGTRAHDLRLILEEDGHVLAAWQPAPAKTSDVPPPATEPPAPADIESADELYVTGLHLDQYRHATRCPTLYWREALRRDPLDARCNNAMGLWRMKRGELAQAETHFRHAIARLTHRNANPADGEAYYNLGVCLCHQADRLAPADAPAVLEQAYAAFYKSTWNMAWQPPAYHALAEIDCRRGHWHTAADHLERSLRMNTQNNGARVLMVLVLRELGQEGDSLLEETLEEDPLDALALWVARREAPADLQTRIDAALDLARAGFLDEARELLLQLEVDGSSDPRNLGAKPMVEYLLGWLCDRQGLTERAFGHMRAAAATNPAYCFPSRLEDIPVLLAAMRLNPADARAPYYLGNLFYDRRRHAEAIKLWTRAAKLDPAFPVAWRNLGIGFFNIHGKPSRACAAYNRAIQAAPGDARLLYERDQLWKRIGIGPRKRLGVLEARADLVALRDDLSVEICALYNQTGQPGKASEVLAGRNFQPWEGGEGMALGQHVRSSLALGRAALAAGDAEAAERHFRHALHCPRNLGEARHLLANQSDIHFWLGEALKAAGKVAEARAHWKIAADFRGDFQEMSVRAFSEMTLYTARAMMRLGRNAAAKKLLQDLLAHARALCKAVAKIDYFATSLPTMLLFDDDLQARQETTAIFLEAQARLGLGERKKAAALLAEVLARDPNHAAASDLLAETQE